tara:strand:+ start:137 stop:391 length:255 start_codon:yes stop_codon:yes gene_type:complete
MEQNQVYCETKRPNGYHVQIELFDGVMKGDGVYQLFIVRARKKGHQYFLETYHTERDAVNAFNDIVIEANKMNKLIEMEQGGLQ